MASEPYSVAWQPDPEPDWHQARLKVRHDPPLRLGLIFGDVIHNLRSALDNLVCQLALLGSGDCAQTRGLLAFLTSTQATSRAISRTLVVTTQRKLSASPMWSSG